MEIVRILVWIKLQWGRGISLTKIYFLKTEITAFILFRKEPAADLKVSSSTGSLLVNNHREC